MLLPFNPLLWWGHLLHLPCLLALNLYSRYSLVRLKFFAVLVSGNLCDFIYHNYIFTVQLTICNKYISLGEEAGCNLLARGRAVHVDDLCDAHIYLFEHPEAKGRYICSSHCFNIIELARSLSLKYSEYNIPTKYASPYALFNFDALTHLYLLPDELGTL